MKESATKHIKAGFKKHTLNFIRPAGTSRGVYHTKNSWFLFLSDGNKTGVGECSILRDLSIDDCPGFEDKLQSICNDINAGNYDFNSVLHEFPAIQFGLETALTDLLSTGSHILFPSEFTRNEKGIPTNGLIWMGDRKYMREQITQKLDAGFSCIKLKIGSLDWPSEQELIANMRKQFSASELTIRVDANGAYSFDEALKVLSDLAKLEVHSIEQPIKAGNREQMAALCRHTPVPIALDEELIGVYPYTQKKKLVETIRPQYLILKPGLLGGFKASNEWIELAQKYDADWWATSALESNIGLNAIAQWVFTKNAETQQGLGTGMLFSNNIDSPLTLKGENLFYIPTKPWATVPH
ncbi:MAG: o-succinylbenzoate synthase [Prolixibacteraceae bacterium]|jgi:o-succinylbenzoate synthase|nr:o-succinylbenzoate synthase [Prolixibacteraceae bacterium]